MRRRRGVQREDREGVERRSAARPHGGLASLPPLDVVAGRHLQPRAAGEGRGRGAHRPDAGRVRRPDVQPRGRDRLRVRARLPRARGRLQPRRRPRPLHQRRPLGRADRRERQAGTGHRHHCGEPGVGRLARLLPGRPPHRLPHAARPRLRVRPLPARGVRPDDEDAPRPHRGVPQLDRRLPLAPRREAHRLPGRGRRAHAAVRARRRHRRGPPAARRRHDRRLAARPRRRRLRPPLGRRSLPRSTAALSTARSGSS